jgi:hypothetical protein
MLRSPFGGPPDCVFPTVQKKGWITPRVIQPFPRPFADGSYCTVSTADPVVPPEFAPIESAPVPKHWAKPATLGALAIVAMLADDELQWLFRVMSCELPSLNVPIAANCCVPPRLQVTVAGEIARELSVPVPTVSVVVPDNPEAEAVIVTDPPFFP